MSEEERMVRDIYQFVHRDMGWEEALDLIIRVAQSDKWIDFLLKEIESLECSVIPHPHIHVFASLPVL